MMLQRWYEPVGQVIDKEDEHNSTCFYYFQCEKNGINISLENIGSSLRFVDFNTAIRLYICKMKCLVRSA